MRLRIQPYSLLEMIAVIALIAILFNGALYLFYNGNHFPENYKYGAFMAIHGSCNRATLPQGGYNVVFLPMKDGKPTGEYEIFADGFAGEDRTPGGALHRPCGLAMGPDGSLYISDDKGGFIWKITYTGEK